MKTCDAGIERPVYQGGGSIERPGNLIVCIRFYTKFSRKYCLKFLNHEYLGTSRREYPRDIASAAGRKPSMDVKNYGFFFLSGKRGKICTFFNQGG